MAIMGRMSAYTGKAVTWEQALNSKLDTFPKHLDMNGSMAEPPRRQAGRDRADLMLAWSGQRCVKRRRGRTDLRKPRLSGGSAAA